MFVFVCRCQGSACLWDTSPLDLADLVGFGSTYVESNVHVPTSSEKLLGGGHRCEGGGHRYWAIAIRVEAIATRVEAIASRVEAIAIRVEAIATRVEAIAIRVEAIATRVEAIATRVEAIAIIRMEAIATSVHVPLCCTGCSYSLATAEPSAVVAAVHVGRTRPSSASRSETWWMHPRRET